MSYNFGGPSNLPFSSSSSSSNDENITQSLLDSIDAKKSVYQTIVVQNNEFIEHVIQSQQQQSQRRGSIPGHIMINRDREIADRNLFDDYFSDNPRFNDQMFLRRYRMSRSLFLRIADAVKNHDHFFQQRRDGLGRLGLSTLQKTTAAFPMLAYGMPADATNEYVKIGESTAIESLKRFCRAIVEIFSERYLRSPTTNDIARLLHIGESRGFPSMLGSLDCMHWTWKNCPQAWAGQYTGRSGKPTIILEAVADYDLWIWHAYFGMTGTSNDINVLHTSHLFYNLSQYIAPPAHYVIGGKEYNMGYYLADGIYPKWATIVQTIHQPQGPKKRLFAQKQESCRKDVERAFGVLQSRFAIVAGPARFWKKSTLHDIMSACIIMHNMIIEDERNLTAPIFDATEVLTPSVEMASNQNDRFQQFIARHREIRDTESHISLRNTLIEHLWELYSNSDE